jgi:hypothetical protein
MPGGYPREVTSAMLPAAAPTLPFVPSSETGASKPFSRNTSAASLDHSEGQARAFSNRYAMARPTPLLAPVTTAARPFN